MISNRARPRHANVHVREELVEEGAHGGGARGVPALVLLHELEAGLGAQAGEPPTARTAVLATPPPGGALGELEARLFVAPRPARPRARRRALLGRRLDVGAPRAAHRERAEARGHAGRARRLLPRPGSVEAVPAARPPEEAPKPPPGPLGYGYRGYGLFKHSQKPRLTD